MCKCTPMMRTPFCGKPGCEWPRHPLTGRLEPEAEQYDPLVSIAISLKRIADHLAPAQAPSLQLSAALRKEGWTTT